MFTAVNARGLRGSVRARNLYLEMSYVIFEYNFVWCVSNTSYYDGVVSSCVVK